jgi:hypothetical protein
MVWQSSVVGLTSCVSNCPLLEQVHQTTQVWLSPLLQLLKLLLGGVDGWVSSFCCNLKAATHVCMVCWCCRGRCLAWVTPWWWAACGPLQWLPHL